MKMEFYSSGIRDTRRAAALLAKEIVSGEKYFDTAFVVALSGELGAGKTFFTRAFAEALGVKARVHSPTFVLMKRYPLRGLFFENLWHLDAYRLDKVAELDPLGFKELLKDSHSIVVVEWAEKIKKLLPKKSTLWIELEHLDSKGRKIIFRS